MNDIYRQIMCLLFSSGFSLSHIQAVVIIYRQNDNVICAKRVKRRKEGKLRKEQVNTNDIK